jgi:serine/threonine protein kinase
LNLASTSVAGLDRALVPSRTRTVLSRGGWGNPDVLLVEAEAGPVVVKDFSARNLFVRCIMGPWLLRREARAYRLLAGIDAVPQLLGWLDDAAIVLEYRPGVFLSRSLSGRLPSGFVEDLEKVIDEMHRRGVVHLDLRHRSNVLASPDGDPIVIDFASSVAFDPSTRLGRLGVRFFAVIDRRALEKWRARLG